MGRKDPEARAESLRRAAEYRLERAQAAGDAQHAETPGDAGEAGVSAAARVGIPPEFHDVSQVPRWVDSVLDEAEARGEFDNLPLAGKPLPGLNRVRDPDWWAKDLVEREQLTGIAPAAYLLRTEDAGLQEQLDRQTSEKAVREILDDFNTRVVEARRQLLGGPPVVTPTRNVDLEVARWRERRAAVRQSAQAAERVEAERGSRPRRTWKDRRRERRSHQNGSG